ncbi:polycystic kidney disease protein 1-like 2 [Patella vulgata]|uniref:polycystic kidney disease protein 1-like 2 n=1 Tax=Patella vulgata TaxID=6465 RepID=UPI0024A8D492|nr:polycystic kidney disease protein 1-like 2 [Patella vulgata]
MRWGVTLLEDNCREDQYYYLITVYTSFVREGGTMSNVSFDIYGEKNNTDVRKLSDGVRKGFKAGSVMHFLMAVPETLGNLQYLRIWHDNAGTGKYASWSLNRVEVVDIQTDESFVFLCNKWFSIEEGVIDRVLPVGGAENFHNFKGLFLEHARNHLTDEHVWVSILFRPVKSNFSRVARVACGVTLLFLCMISNAMFFENGDNKDRQRSSSIELGPIKFNPSQVYISLVSVILTAIPVYVIMTVFRKSKPKPWERRKKQIRRWFPKYMREKLEFSQKLEDILVIPDNIAINDASLPSWGVYIGWFLSFVASFVSCFFIMLYSIEWGKDVSEEWLTTFILSFLQSLLFVDPFKSIPATYPLTSMWIFRIRVYNMLCLITQVIQSSHYFEWLNKTALPSLFPEEDYRGIRMTATERLFSYNSANVKVGPPRLRQVRARAGNCSYPYIGHTTCIPVYDVIQENTDNYCPNWTPQPCSDAEESTLTVDAWTFTSATSIWGAPIAGLLTLYGGGGYIANMDINKIVSTESLQELFETHWIDRQTRAVFFEFTLYNIDINMFVYVSILTEFPETGGVVTYKNIFPFRSSQHVGTLGKFILICELVAMLYIVVSAVIIGIKFAKQKWLFFTKFWNLAEFFTVGVAVVAIVFYILRDQYANQALAAFNENNREFVNFYRVVIWDYAFVSVLGMLVTIATLRLLKAMAFTDITFKVFDVLKQTSKVFPGFATFILINLLSFSSASYFMFGRTGAPYKSMITSMETMFIGLIGDTTFKKTNSEVALDTVEIIWFSFFVICVTIILINLFLAILMDVMTRTQDEPPSKRDVNLNVFSYIWGSMVRGIVDKPPDYTCLHPDIQDQPIKDNRQPTGMEEDMKTVSNLSVLIIQQLKNNPEFEKEMAIWEKKVGFSE